MKKINLELEIEDEQEISIKVKSKNKNNDILTENERIVLDWIFSVFPSFKPQISESNPLYDKILKRILKDFPEKVERKNDQVFYQEGSKIRRDYKESLYIDDSLIEYEKNLEKVKNDFSKKIERTGKLEKYEIKAFEYLVFNDPHSFKDVPSLKDTNFYNIFVRESLKKFITTK